MWNLKYDTNESIYETERELQTIEKKLVVSKGGMGEGRMEWEVGVSRYKLLHIERITTRSYCIAQRTIFNIP